MALDLFTNSYSSGGRIIRMLAKAIDVTLNQKLLNIHIGEQLQPEFIAVNPQHTIPTLVDRSTGTDFIIWESRAILIYLAETYGGKTTLYPSDPKQRAIVNQRIFFDLGTLFQRFDDYIRPIFYNKQTADQAKFKKLEEALEYLNIFLQDQPYVAGDCLTIADYTIIATISTMEIFNINIGKFVNVKRWFDHLKATMPGYEINQDGLNKSKKYIDEILFK